MEHHIPAARPEAVRNPNASQVIKQRLDHSVCVGGGFCVGCIQTSEILISLSASVQASTMPQSTASEGGHSL